MDTFTITVEHKGKEYQINGELLQLGYTYKIHLDVEGIPVVLEPDEERNYRAVVAEEYLNKISPALLKLIVEELGQHLK